MNCGIITLTTDFGISDSYVAQMKGVILGLNSSATIVDVTHAIPPQNIAAGAAILDEVVDAFPSGTIHVAVVDPGVGSERSLVAVEMGDWRFITPDNGLLTAVATRFPPLRIVRLTEPEFWRNSLSRTFHGRDVLASVAAHWSLGVDVTKFGESIPSLVTIPLPTAKREKSVVRGEITHIDHFGNVITSIGHDLLTDDDLSQVQVECAEWIIVGVRTHYAEVEPGSLVALFGSSGKLEIAVRDGSAAEMLKAYVDMPIRIVCEP